ncbi:MAG: hypothetical protein NC093_06970 [Alistipes sp.]|nr:hypothetical protein [Alistipes sp.]
MKINLKSGQFSVLTKEFPMNVFELQDTLDKLKIPDDKPIVQFEISEYNNMELPMSICDKKFSADIYKLNLFAERLENLDPSEMTAFKSLLVSNPECDFEGILLMTYGLDSVMVYPCQNCRELGETVIENEMLPELEGCSDKILKLLDREKVGKLMQERDCGVFIGENYCVTSGYEPPDINIEIGRPERCFFRLLIAPIKQNGVPDYDSAQWLSLPFDEKNQDIDFEKMTCVKRESSLPELPQNQLTIENIHKLNDLAKSLSELSHNDFVKLKAVMETENIHDIYDAATALDRLSEYEFDRSVQDYNEFGRSYLSRNLPTNFDVSTLEDMDLYDFSLKILAQTGGEVTSYGAISGRGQELYSALTVQPVQQLVEDFEEECEEDFDEDIEMEMGGMSL